MCFVFNHSLTLAVFSGHPAVFIIRPLSPTKATLLGVVPKATLLHGLRTPCRGSGVCQDWSCEAIEAFQIDGHSHGLGRALLQLASSASARQKAATKAH